ncbi:Asp-tRNA(Asn)/Glu-tRNA(Gln) amidotransferase subunit GatC [Crassaminicella thermophila]|uniref:Aspartyl/glutamyl-tRNA(Asn/Gln) amidotransferase subunit C n=1 Tax=Crassaminicella thermophila TaxID=2599308 RepID=A0A5C0SEV3_CRATE|nr:Asp-tRNA(Asn)/Glu-tRNA(Gln) amidotransferase subunit GatC [Crassaminicella thermophila]QEK12973.1 Asp-tRNA(Asn)/Glu-tRNA(Gln) amidotransferase subunit GatC [Crassaminicella thermophila]
MAISIKDVEHIADLARLSFTEEEKIRFINQFKVIIEYIDKLNKVDVEGVEPNNHIIPLKNIFREDEIKISMEKEKVLMNAPDQQDGCFRVPKIIE